MVSIHAPAPEPINLLGNGKTLLGSKVPVIPLGTIGCYEILPKGAVFPRFKRCELHIGKPLDFEKYFGEEDNSKILNIITTEIMKEIGKLAKLDY